MSSIGHRPAVDQRAGAAPERAAHRLYAHIVWATRGRDVLATPAARGAIESHLISLCRRLDVEPIAVAALTDRAHLLLRFKPTHSLGAVVVRLKAGLAGGAPGAASTIRWARGYAAITVGSKDVRRVMRHLARLGDACDTTGQSIHGRRKPRRASRRHPLTPPCAGR